MTLDEFLPLLKGVSGSGYQYSARCPAHDDKHESLSVSVGEDGKILLKCHAGCNIRDIADSLGLSVKDLFVSTSLSKEKPGISARYNYTDEFGNLLAQKTRWSDKHFSWSRPDGRGGWVKGRGKLQIPPYNLPAIISAERVYIVEGEKDVETLKALNVPAGCSPDGAGAGKWKDYYSGYFRGKQVVIIQDNDEVGKAFAAETASALKGIAESVRLIDLSKIWPELPEHGDTTDLIEYMGTGAVEAIDKLSASLPEFEPSEIKAEPEPSFFIDGKFRHNRMGDYLIKKLSVCKINGTLHIYNNGIYQHGEDVLHGHMIQLMPEITDARRKEVYKYIKASLSTPAKELSPPNLIPFASRIYDIETDSFLEYSPEYVFLNRFPYDYKPGAPYADLIHQTIFQIAGEDMEVIELLYEAIGNCFYLLNSYRGAVMLYGKSGSNGKSTLLNMIAQVIGRENASFLSLQDLSEKFRLMEIYGKAANIGDDIPGTFIPDSAAFKKCVTGEYVTGEKKGQDPVSFSPYAKMFFAMNGLPAVSDKSKAYFGRILLIPLNQDFSQQKGRNVNLKSRKWTQSEMEWLTCAAVEGLKQLRKRGDFIRPKCVEEALRRYELDNNPVREFLDEYGMKNVEGKPTQIIYDNFCLWCQKSGHRNILTRRKFSDEIIRITGFVSKPVRHAYFGGNAGRCFIKE